jgi:hypothetical protein
MKLKLWIAERRRRAKIRAIKRDIVAAEYRWRDNDEEIPDWEWADYDNRLKCLGDRTGAVR